MHTYIERERDDIHIYIYKYRCRIFESIYRSLYIRARLFEEVDAELLESRAGDRLPQVHPVLRQNKGKG